MKMILMHMKAKCRISILLLFITAVLISASDISAQKVQPFIYDCVITGQSATMDAVITNADANTFYHWQFKQANSNWSCFVNGANLINGVNFNVSGATGIGANDAPALTIQNAGPALENVLVRILMSHGQDPCGSNPGQVWGGDDQSQSDTKYFRLHVYNTPGLCPPNSFQCPNNMLVNANKFYGGFENYLFDVNTETLNSFNFGSSIAGTDLVYGQGRGHYMDINNPYAMNNSFAKNVAPHTGNHQLVIEGAANNTDRVWYKTINVSSARQYAFSVWVARVDSTAPQIDLKANNTNLVAVDLTTKPVGEWNLIQGTFQAAISGPVTFSIRDSKNGGGNNFSIDDICLRECTSCATLQLHSLNLKAVLQNNDVNLSWVAENEMGTVSFSVERSLDGFNYDRIAMQAPSGPVNIPRTYLHTDNIQNTGVSQKIYYRIKAMDTDGRFAYSNVVIVRLNDDAAIDTWPVPFINTINFTYNAAVNSKIDVSIINGNGKLMGTFENTVTRGYNVINLKDLDKFATGIYVIRIINRNTGEVSSAKVFK